MNLNKQIRANLLSDVLKDQFSDDVNLAQDKLNKEIIKEVIRLDGGASKRILAALKKEKSDFLSVSVQQSASCDSLFKRWASNRKVENPFNPNGHAIFMMRKSTTLGFDVVCQFDCGVEPSSGILTAYTELCDLFKSIEDIKDSLAAVLSSVRTVRKLNDITGVFTPFIKIDTKTSLLPSEDICKINMLKSPKAEK